MKHGYQLSMLCILPLFFLSTGCSTVAYVSTPDRLDAIDNYTTLEVAPIELSEEVWEGVSEENVAYIREEFIKRFQDKKLMPVVTTQADATTSVLTLKVKITKFEKGSRFARWFIGFGAGKAKLFMHVSLIDKESRAVVGETDVRKTVSGGFYGGAADARKMGKEMAKGVEKFIKQRGQGGKAPGTVLSLREHPASHGPAGFTGHSADE